MTSVESQTAALNDRTLTQSASDAPWWSQSGGPVFWLICLIPTIPLALTHWLGLLGNSQYAFLPLPFVLVAFLYWQRAEGTIGRPESITRWTVVVAGLIAVLLGGLIAFPWLGALGFVLIAAAALSGVRGTIQRSLVSLIAPLLAVSLPSGLTDVIASIGNRGTAWLSSIFLDYFEVPHSVSGSVIRLFESEVVTSKVCGGMVAFPFFLFLAFSLVAWKRMSLWLLPVYAAAAVITTLAINSLRLVFSVIAAESMEMDLAEGWYPLGMSAIAGLLGFGLLYSFHHLFAIGFHHVEANEDSGSNPFVRFWNKFSWMNENRASEEFSHSSSRHYQDQNAPDLASPVWFGLLGAAAILTVLSVLGSFRGGSDDLQAIASSGPLFIPTENLFSDLDSNDAVQIKNYKTTADESSPDSSSTRRDDSWTGTFRGGNLTLQVTQPLSGWLEITRAYQGRGWEIIDRDTDSIELAVTTEDNGDDGKDSETNDTDLSEEPEDFNAFATVRMRSGEDSAVEGYLYYSAIGSDGKVLKTPTALSSLWQDIRSKLGIGNAGDVKTNAMVQLLVVTGDKLSPGDIRTLKREFVKYREVIEKAIIGDEPASITPRLEEQTRSISPSPRVKFNWSQS